MKRNLLFSTLFLCLSVLFFSACKKEEISPTPGEVTANELKAVIERNGVKRVYPVKINTIFPSQFPADKGLLWSFSNGFINIDYSSFNQGYNLEYLVSYAVVKVGLNNGSTDYALILYMEQ